MKTGAAMLKVFATRFGLHCRRTSGFAGLMDGPVKGVVSARAVRRQTVRCAPLSQIGGWQ